jgi:hypothetical protein
MKPIVGWMIAASLLVAGEKSEDLLENGGFEAGLHAWNAIDTTQQGRIEVIAKNAKEGKKALVIERKGGTGVVMVRQDLRGGAPAGEVTLAVSYRNASAGRAQVSLWGYDGRKDAPVLDEHSVEITGPNKKWEHAEKRIRIPDGVVKLAVGIRVLGDGEFVFDDVRLLRTSAKGAKPSGPIRNGGFESGLFAWETEFASGRTTAEVSAQARRSGEKGLRLRRTARCEVPWDGVVTPLESLPRQPFSVRAAARAEGARCRLEVRFLDARGVLVKCVEVGAPAAPAGRRSAERSRLPARPPPR